MSKKCVTFYSTVTKLPVTSVTFLDTYILAGIGGALYIFECPEKTEKHSKINIFDNSVVHGIVPKRHTKLAGLCAYGGYEVAILDTNSISSNPRLTIVRKWREADWVLHCQWIGAQEYLAVLSAHNVISLRDSCGGTKITSVPCMEKCILYSATIIPNANKYQDTVVIAGTVFQQIIVWAVADDSLVDRPVLHKLSGHKGVIFSVKYDERLRQICSTSDDRSVRVWSVSSTSRGPLTADHWRVADITLTVTIFGHTARVWQSCILADRRIISIGEDSMLCLWGPDGEKMSQRETHQGGGTWCMDVSGDESLVVTGGADGGVMLWPVDPPPDTSTALPPPPDTPRRVALLRGGLVITVTERGKLMAYRDQAWSCQFEDPRIASYCLLEVSPSREYIGLATIIGHIILLESNNFEVVLDQLVFQSKIYSLHWLDETTLLSCHDDGQLFIWCITESGLKEAGRCHLPSCKERWTTSAVMCRDTVVYGDRAGNIHSSPLLPQLANVVDAVHTVRRAHSRLGVCSLSVVGDEVWSTGRDGMLRRYTVSDRDHSLMLVSASKLQLDWAADIIHLPSLGTAVVCFHQSCVVLWDAHNRVKLLSLPCGGGHRSWSHLIQDGNFIFTFLKDKTAHLLHTPLLPIPTPVLLEGFHTREINSMAYISKGWIVSGGEDGTVGLSRLSRGGWTTCVVERNHLSSVRAVSVATIEERMLLFSAGGRAQMKVWRVNLEEPACLSEVTSSMLRAERKGRHWLLNDAPVSDPETRYMDVHTLPGPDQGVIHVLVACSDAFLRVFHFDLKKQEIGLVKSVRRSCHCMLRVSSFECGHSKTVVVTSATDGRVVFWTWPACDVISEDSLHQSGVNGLCVRAAGEAQGGRHVVIATGGDDNCVAVSLYLAAAATSQPTVQRLDKWTNSGLHSSIVTGVEIVGARVLCCGGDQRVTVLAWSVADGRLSVQPLAQHCCSVPDLKGLVMLSDNREKLKLSVYGVGMEVIEVVDEC